MNRAITLRRWRRRSLGDALALSCVVAAILGGRPGLFGRATASSGPPPQEITCFGTDRPVVAIANDGIWTSNGKAYDDRGKLLRSLPISHVVEVDSIASDGPVTVLAAGPDPDGSDVYLVEAFDAGTRSWTSILPVPTSLERVRLKVVILPEMRGVSVVVHGRGCRDRTGDCDKSAAQARKVTYWTELRSFSRDGKLVSARQLPAYPIEDASFSLTGDLALAGFAERRIDLDPNPGPRHRIDGAGPFVVLYDRDGEWKWSRAFTQPKSRVVGVKFDANGDLWSGIAPCVATGTPTYSVVGTSGGPTRLPLKGACVGYVHIGAAGEVQPGPSICPSSGVTRLCPPPSRLDPLALFGNAGPVFGQAPDSSPLGTDVVDLVPKGTPADVDRFVVLPISDAGRTAVRTRALASAVGIHQGRLCIALANAMRESVACDRFTQTGSSRSYGAIVACLAPREPSRRVQADGGAN